MKKYFVILFTFFYLVLATGIDLHAHFCGKTLVGISLFENEEGCCPKTTSCCKNETTTLKIQDEHHQATHLTIDEVAPIYLQTSSTLIKLELKLPNSTSLFDNYIFPPPEKCPLFIRDCHFTI